MQSAALAPCGRELELAYFISLAKLVALLGDKGVVQSHFAGLCLKHHPGSKREPKAAHFPSRLIICFTVELFVVLSF